MNPANYGRNLFPESGTSPSKPGLVLFQVLLSTLLILQEPCEQLAIIYGAAAERPVVQAPVLSEQSSSSLCFVSHHRYWDQEVLRAKKDAQEPSLMKAIVKCYWNFYFVLGLLTFLEVKAFPCCALLLSVCRSLLIWMRWWGERTVVYGLKIKLVCES